MNIIKHYSLSNGLEISIVDRTFRYFGNYFTVFLELEAKVAVKKEYFENSDEFDNAVKLIGREQVYKREIKRQGVVEEELGKIKDEVIKYFEEHSISYLEKETFLKKFIFKRIKEEQRKAEIRKLRDKIAK